jgi:subtilisin family serine protease/subtilisin-like proprotein convertase family protein
MRTIWIYLSFLAALLGGCKKSQNQDGGGGGGDTTVSPPQDLGSATAKQDFLFQYQPAITAPEGGSFTLTKKPAWMKVDSKTGMISGVPSDPGSFPVVVTAKNGDGQQASGTFTVDVTGDPLGKYQWPLENLGTMAFSRNDPLPGQDMGVKDVHRFGVTGKGVTVLVSDEGLQLTHEDLEANVATGKSKNYNLADPFFGDPAKPNPPDGNHGTSVAGIIAAAGWNGKGGRGVAPEAKVAGTNFLKVLSDHSEDETYDYLPILIDQASNNDAAGAKYDVFNYSYGYGAPFQIEVEPELLDQLIYGVSKHRDGKGSVYVKSAGNDYEFYNRGINSGSYEDNTTPYVIVVGAVNASGRHSSYSSAGANLLVSAPGGEYGDDYPAIITTDEMGCVFGYSPLLSAVNGFEGGGSPNTGCNYTSAFNGTSSAAPHVSGTVALMLAANPALTWRDVRHLLATTATPIDTNYAAKTSKIGAVTYVLEDTWVTNGSGLKFHPQYGFGRVDADAAVHAAASYSSMLPPMKQTVTKSGNCPDTEFCHDDTWLFSNTTSQTIPDNNATGVTSTISVTSNYKIEAIQIRARITTAIHGDIGIRLTSPTGTSFNIKDPRKVLIDSGTVEHTYLSNAYYGETSSGTWTLKVWDAQTGTNSPVPHGSGTGTLVRWSINVIGHDP